MGSNDFKGTKMAHVCSMKITEDVRKHAAEQKMKVFLEKGAEVYAKT